MSIFKTKAPAIMRLLMKDFTLTPEQAAAIVGNLGHESGGFRFLQEKKPLVPGSRGGYGWAQWTGPRRKQYEAYCARNNLDPAGDKANYGFLFVELTTTEAKAIPAVKKATGLTAQVKGFELAFERAGIKHYDSRINYATQALAAYHAEQPSQRKAAKKPAVKSLQTAPVPVTADRPGIWATLWRVLRGKDAAIATPTVKDRPGMGLNGDNALYDQQVMLSDKGYTEVGQPDGLMGGRTVNAIRAFRAETGLPPGDAIDTKFSAALAAAGPRQIAKARVETKASDLREKGNEQVATLDSLGWLGKALGLGGILGGLNESGVLSQATDTLQTAQDTLGSIATVFTTIIGAAQWCFAHWWIFAILGGLYVVFKVASGVLHVVVMFRQGFLARADK